MTTHKKILEQARNIETGRELSEEPSGDPTNDGRPLALARRGVNLMKANPGASFLIGTGLAWIALRGDKTVARKAQKRVLRLKNHTQEGLEEAKEQAKSSFEQAKVSSQQKASELRRETISAAHERPLILGAAAMVSGLAVGLLLSRRENPQAHQPDNGVSLVDQAKKIVDEARAATMRTLNSGKELIEEHLDKATDGLVEMAQEAVEDAAREPDFDS